MENHVHIHLPGGIELPQLNFLIQKFDEMKKELEDLTAEVRETRGVLTSAVTLIEGLADKLEEAGTDAQALANLKNELREGKDTLAEALTANADDDNDGIRNSKDEDYQGGNTGNSGNSGNSGSGNEGTGAQGAGGEGNPAFGS